MLKLSEFSQGVSEDGDDDDGEGGKIKGKALKYEVEDEEGDIQGDVMEEKKSPPPKEAFSGE